MCQLRDNVAELVHTCDQLRPLLCDASIYIITAAHYIALRYHFHPLDGPHRHSLYGLHASLWRVRLREKINRYLPTNEYIGCMRYISESGRVP